MKKRVLSLALAILMLVLSAPLFVLVGTAEENGGESYNYDSLYVQLGLIMQYDFFKLNEYWAPAGEEYEKPDSIYSQTDGEGQLLFDELSERVTLVKDGEKITSATIVPTFSAAVEAYRKEANGLLDSFKIGGVGRMVFTLPGIGAASYQNQTGLGFEMAADLGDGYIKLRNDIDDNSYINIGGVGNMDETATLQLVMRPGGVTNKDHAIVFHGVSTRLTAASGGYAFTLPANKAFYNNIIYSMNGESASFPTDKVGDFTLSVSHPAGDLDAMKAGSGAFSVRYNANELFSAVITYEKLSALSWTETNMLGFYSSADMALYAVRVYNRALSNDEILINHFADLAKFYKLDVGMYEKLSDKERASFAAHFSDYRIGSSDKDELQAEVSARIADAVYDVLLQEDTVNPGRFEFCELVKSLGVDIAAIRALPVEYRGEVYAASLGLIEKTKETVQVAIDTVITSIIEENYGDFITETGITYKDLYVKQENLTVWVDFFAARDTDGNVYPAETYQDPATRDLAYKDRVKTKHTATGAQPYNEDVMLKKYRFRGNDNGTSAFYLYDITAAGFGHTNIRTYGDGRLECGINNSIGVLSPGTDSDVTYQFVANFQSASGSGTVNAGLQLDGFRLSFCRDRQGKPYLSRLQYFGFGPTSSVSTTLNPSNTAMWYYGQNAYFSGATFSADITLVSDKRIGIDGVHYYTVDYLQNGAGQIAYTATASEIPPASSLQMDGTHYIYKQKGDAKLYITPAGGALYSLDSSQTKVTYFYLVDKGEGNYAYVDVNGIEWMQTTEENIDMAKAKATAATEDDKPIALVGPYYDRNTVTEVPAGTPGALGPYSYYGRMDVSAYVNSDLMYRAEDISYMADQPGSVGNAADMTLYAVRAYNCTLTQEEIMQNHFADLAGYYGFDLSLYTLLSDEQKSELYRSLTKMELGDNRTACTLAYEELVSSMLYIFDSDSPAAEHFRAVCESFFLNVSSVMQLSAAGRERVFESFLDIDPESRQYKAILQARLEEAVEKELLEHYDEATIHKTIGFFDWQLHVYGTPGFRARFEVNNRHLSTLLARNTDVQIGVMVAKKGSGAGRFADEGELLPTVSSDGVITFAEGITSLMAYQNGAYTENVMQENGGYYFAEEVFPTADEYEDEYFCVAFVVLKSGSDIFVYTETAAYGRDNAPSLEELTGDALSLNWAYPNIHDVLSITRADDGYDKVPLYIGGNLLSDLRVSPEGLDRTALEAVNALIKDYAGVSLIEGEGDGPMVYIGKIDTVYEGPFYGISIQDGDLLLWYNDEADLTSLLELLDEILSHHYSMGTDIQLPEGLDIVRRSSAQ